MHTTALGATRTELAAACPPASVRMTTPDGCATTPRLDPLAQLIVWASALFAGEHGLVELAPGDRLADGSLRVRRTRDPRAYHDCRRPVQLALAALQHARSGRECFAGPLPRAIAVPGGAAVSGGRVAWVDIDQGDAIAALAAFRPSPSLIVASGGDTGAHGYWLIDRRLPARALEELNGALARRLDADAAVRDRGRLMRLPGTRNGKSGRPCRLVAADLRGRRHDPAALAGFDWSPEPRPICGALVASTTKRRDLQGLAWLPDPLRAIAPPTYFRALAGVAVDDAGGTVRCPLPGHGDSTASCHVYAAPDQGWWCYGCYADVRVMPTSCR